MPSERCTRAAIVDTGDPSRAWVSSSRSRPVSGLGPSISDSAARSGSMTRRPAWTRRTASASWRAGRVLDDEARRPRLDRPADVARPAEGRDDQGPHAGQLASYGRGGVDAVEAGHLDVEQAHLGPRGAGGVDHLVAATDLRHDLEVGLEVEQRGQRATHERLVVGEQQPDHGRATSTRVPGAAGPTARVPPAPVTRSRMPRRPLPSRAVAAGAVVGHGDAGGAELDERPTAPARGVRRWSPTRAAPRPAAPGGAGRCRRRTPRRSW